jgi:hypothetical protein
MVTGHHTAPVDSLWHGCVSCLFVGELGGLFVLGDLEQFHSTLLIQGKAIHFLDRVLYKLIRLTEAPILVALPHLAHVHGYLVTFIESHGYGIV